MTKEGKGDLGKSDSPHQSSSVIWQTLLAGPVASSASRFIIHPWDTVKAQLQVQGAAPGAAGATLYKGTTDAVVQLAALAAAGAGITSPHPHNHFPHNTHPHAFTYLAALAAAGAGYTLSAAAATAPPPFSPALPLLAWFLAAL
eukprot:gene31972-33899_t